MDFRICSFEPFAIDFRPVVAPIPLIQAQHWASPQIACGATPRPRLHCCLSFSSHLHAVALVGGVLALDFARR